MKRIGIIVGRFQVPVLHPGHRYLIQTALEEYDDLHLIVGITKGNKLDSRNPLPFEARKIMLLEEFPVLFEKIHTIEDIGNWPKWVEALDKILEPFSEGNQIVIVGSRDSVATRYKEFGGKFDTAIIEPLKTFSGTEAREVIKNKFQPIWHKEARKIAVWALSNLKED